MSVLIHAADGSTVFEDDIIELVVNRRSEASGTKRQHGHVHSRSKQNTQQHRTERHDDADDDTSQQYGPVLPLALRRHDERSFLANKTASPTFTLCKTGAPSDI
jgi:hypothetical protein